MMLSSAWENLSRTCQLLELMGQEFSRDLRGKKGGDEEDEGLTVSDVVEWDKYGVADHSGAGAKAAAPPAAMPPKKRPFKELLSQYQHTVATRLFTQTVSV